MPFVSITRLRVRSLRFMPAFIVHTLGANAQVKTAAGFLAGSLLPDRQRAFWTMTLWRDPADMRRYITSGAHFRTMPKLMRWCDEASIVHWDQGGPSLPSWPDADQRMRAEGRPSKVLHPSADHQNLTYAAPRLAGAAPIMPK